MVKFTEIGIIEKSHTGRSLKIYAIIDGKAAFIGLVSLKALRRLLRGETTLASICQYSGTPNAAKVVQPFNLSIKLADPAKLKLEGSAESHER